jgi:mono/diheme cytochrome c family protein
MRRALLVCGACGLALVGALVLARGMGITALREPLAFEDRAANAAWRFLVPREIGRRSNPVPDSPDVRRASLGHFADHCAVCHASDGGGDSSIGRRVFPPVPDLRRPETQRLTDGELFYAIEQGIPWTAMPGWRTGTAEGERESWALVRLVRGLPSLTPAEREEIERMIPRSPPDTDRERDIEDFLSGKKQ